MAESYSQRFLNWRKTVRNVFLPSLRLPTLRRPKSLATHCQKNYKIKDENGDVLGASPVNSVCSSSSSPPISQIEISCSTEELSKLLESLTYQTPNLVIDSQDPIQSSTAQSQSTVSSLSSSPTSSAEPLNFIAPPIREENMSIVIGDNKGIEGNNNSCYMDVALFCFFCFSNLFDQLLLPSLKRDLDSSKELVETTRSSLRGIVNSLRRNGFTSSEEMKLFRGNLAALLNKNIYLVDKYDSQQFMEDLFRDFFEMPNLIPLGKYSSGENDIFHQFLSNEACEDGEILTIQSALKKSQSVHGVQFNAVPFPALIIQVQVANPCGNEFGGFLPNLSINLNEYMSDNYRSAYPQDDHLTMKLVGVICYNKERVHYTCFVRAGSKTNSSWVYFDPFVGDSNDTIETPSTRYPMVVDLPNFHHLLTKELERSQQERLFLATTDNKNEYFTFLIQKAVIFIYAATPDALPSVQDA